METAVRQVSNADGSIYIFDLYKNDGSFSYEPVLVFEGAKYDSTWDNSDYVVNFLRGLKKGKKKQRQELKEFCKENNFDFGRTRATLEDIYKTAKKLQFFK